MKKLSFLLLAIVFSIAVSCKKDAASNSTSNSVIESQKAIVASNTWKVTSFIENGVDQTSDFATYLLQFNNDGSAVATSTGIGILYYGSWNLMKGSHSEYDDSGNHLSGDSNILGITLTGHYHMDEISEDWKIVKLTDTETWLLDDNKTSSKEIHFTKNS